MLITCGRVRGKAGSVSGASVSDTSRCSDRASLFVRGGFAGASEICRYSERIFDAVYVGALPQPARISVMAANAIHEILFICKTFFSPVFYLTPNTYHLTAIYTIGKFLSHHGNSQTHGPRAVLIV